MSHDFSNWVGSNGFVARRSRILYVATPKVACTAIRAMYDRATAEIVEGW